MKYLLVLFFNICFECLSNFKPVIIKFDYLNLNITDKKLKSIVQKEFSSIEYYINNLLLFPPNKFLSNKLKQFPNSIIRCEDKTEYKFNKIRFSKNTNLLIIPTFKINGKSQINDKPILKKCITYNHLILVIILTFEYKSSNLMKKKINLNFKNMNYQWLIIRFILTSLGFNSQSLMNKSIVNNIFLQNQDLLKKFTFYDSFAKFTLLNNYTITESKNGENYTNFWPNIKKLDDIMNIEDIKTSDSISEMTIHLMESLGYKINPCEFFPYKNKCYRINKKCLNDFDSENYFIYYTIDTRRKRWICYYKKEEHFKKNQCSKDYGILLNYFKLNKELLIDYLRKYNSQKLVLLKPSPLCPRPHPRTVFFMSVKPKEDPYQYKSLENIEEVEIKNPNYFIITNADPKYYDVKYFTANYNVIFANNLNDWNSNYIWKYRPVRPYTKDLSIYKNKFKLIGQFPDGNTFKDGLSKFFDNLIFLYWK